MSANTTLDVNRSTRREWTDAITSKPIPENASEQYRKYHEKLVKLLRLLMEDEAMAPNLDQIWMQPANSKNKVYFMWDFVGRTTGMLHSLDPTKPLDGRQEAKDVVASDAFADILMTNDPSDSKMRAMFPNDSTQFSDDIKALINEYR